ncbi:hypothetical protein U1Q18_043164 [Sarracenia purpurea var. burkii]
MDGNYGLYSQGWSSLRNEELQEEDVWAVLKDRKDFTSSKVGSSQSSTITARRLPSASNMVPRAKDHNFTQDPKMVHQSATVNIPDWSKIYGKNSKKVQWLDDDDHGHGDDNHGLADGGGNGVMKGSWDSDDDDDDDMDGKMMPPHEWIAWKLARSQVSSFSVCEGAGRTLKGRDLSRVRNAVLTRTGFLEGHAHPPS